MRKFFTFYDSLIFVFQNRNANVGVGRGVEKSQKVYLGGVGEEAKLTSHRKLG